MLLPVAGGWLGWWRWGWLRPTATCVLAPHATPGRALPACPSSCLRPTAAPWPGAAPAAGDAALDASVLAVGPWRTHSCLLGCRDPRLTPHPGVGCGSRAGWGWALPDGAWLWAAPAAECLGRREAGLGSSVWRELWLARRAVTPGCRSARAPPLPCAYLLVGGVGGVCTGLDKYPSPGVQGHYTAQIMMQIKLDGTINTL